jgi:hypothetical protein
MFNDFDVIIINIFVSCPPFFNNFFEIIFPAVHLQRPQVLQQQINAAALAQAAQVAAATALAANNSNIAILPPGSVGGATSILNNNIINNTNIQLSRQQEARLQQLQLERERLKLRQQEIMQQV